MIRHLLSFLVAATLFGVSIARADAAITLRTSWTASSPAATAGYKVYRKIDAGAAVLMTQTNPGVLNFDDVIASPIGVHSFQYCVSGLNNNGIEGAQVCGTAQNFTIPEPTPGPPGSVSTSQI